MQPDTQSLLRDGGLGDEGDGEEGEDDGWLQISREYVRTRRAWGALSGMALQMKKERPTMDRLSSCDKDVDFSQDSRYK